MVGKPMLFKDIESMRTRLTIPAFDRVRVLLSAEDRKLRVDLECVACEELLEWVSSKSWWVCPECNQETTDTEVEKLLRSCYEGLGEILGRTETETDEGQGIGQWVRTLMKT